MIQTNILVYKIGMLFWYKFEFQKSDQVYELGIKREL